MSSHPGISDFDRLPPVARATTRAEWAALIGIWAFFDIRSIRAGDALFRTSGVPTSHWPIAVHTSFEVFVWIVATPLLFAVLDRTPVMRGVRVRHVAVRLVLAAVATVVHAALSRGACSLSSQYMGADPRLYTSDVLSWQATLGYSARRVRVYCHSARRHSARPPQPIPSTAGSRAGILAGASKTPRAVEGAAAAFPLQHAERHRRARARKPPGPPRRCSLGSATCCG